MSKSPITSPLGDAERSATGAVLQATLVDLIDLSLIAKQAHWNVVGPNFRSAHLQLDELVAAARQFVDEVAERANAIGISPNGKVKTVLESSGIPEYPDNGHPGSADRDQPGAGEAALDVAGPDRQDVNPTPDPATRRRGPAAENPRVPLPGLAGSLLSTTHRPVHKSISHPYLSVPAGCRDLAGACNRC